MADQPRRLELEVRFDATPIEGRLYDDERERSFRGWLGLMAAIEAARTPRDESESERPAR